MKRPIICAALALLVLTAPAAAQGYGPGALPPHEILTILRSTGLDPLSQPVRRGPNYVLRAIDDADREVSVVVSARSGDVLSVTPVQTASRIPPSGGITMGPYEPMPRGWVPGSDQPEAYRPPPPGGYRAGAPVVDDDDEPMVETRPRALPPPGGVATRDVDASPSEPHVITADPDRSGLLPPPPERFPQRVAPHAAPNTAAKPKPAKSAAAAAPKPAPLPKPKPAQESKAAGAPVAKNIDMPTMSPLIVPEPPQRKAPVEETPH